MLDLISIPELSRSSSESSESRSIPRAHAVSCNQLHPAACSTHCREIPRTDGLLRSSAKRRRISANQSSSSTPRSRSIRAQIPTQSSSAQHISMMNLASAELNAELLSGAFTISLIQLDTARNLDEGLGLLQSDGDTCHPRAQISTQSSSTQHISMKALASAELNPELLSGAFTMSSIQSAKLDEGLGPPTERRRTASARGAQLRGLSVITYDLSSCSPSRSARSDPIQQVCRPLWSLRIPQDRDPNRLGPTPKGDSSAVVRSHM